MSCTTQAMAMIIIAAVIGARMQKERKLPSIKAAEIICCNMACSFPRPAEPAANTVLPTSFLV